MANPAISVNWFKKKQTKKIICPFHAHSFTKQCNKNHTLGNPPRPKLTVLMLRSSIYPEFPPLWFLYSVQPLRRTSRWKNLLQLELYFPSGSKKISNFQNKIIWEVSKHSVFKNSLGLLCQISWNLSIWRSPLCPSQTNSFSLYLEN